jgi:hypothetical protein
LSLPLSDDRHAEPGRVSSGKDQPHS